MNNKKLFEDIYNDFFENEIESQEEIIEEEEKEEDIDNLYIDKNSKKLLKNIIDYMKKYNDNKINTYITFNIKIISDNTDITDKIANILKEKSSKYNYIENKNIIKCSLYKDTNIDNIYSEYGVIVLKDLKAFELLETKEKEKFIYSLKENTNKNAITIINDTKENIDNFLNYSNELNNSFSFEIISTKPSINELYTEIINTIKLTNKQNIELLDYIGKTYNTSNLDYINYKNNLIKSISFTKKVPEVEENKSLEEIFKELEELVGLQKIKKTLYELVDLIELKKKNKSLKISNINLHMVFLGNPGTGKTTVARIIAEILYNLNYIRSNKLIEVTSKDLVAEYVGQTAPKTASVIEKALGGVLFIDEAYSLASKDGNSYNDEAIATLIQKMETHRDDLVVIFAGYTKEMRSFLDSNSGIVSRIGYTLEFEDYTKEELTQIFINMMKKAGFIVTKEALDKVGELIDKYKDSKNFGNARFIRNVYEKSVIKHASNTKNTKDKEKIITITKEDISDDNLIKE